MLKLLASIIIALNVVVNFFLAGSILTKDASKNEAPLLFAPSPEIQQMATPEPIPTKENNASQAYQLPLQADTFLITRYLPIFPLRNWNIPEPEIQAKTALVYDTAHQEILYQKNDLYEQRPIASLTKLMTALVVLENTDLNSVFKISPNAVQTEGEMGNLRVGEELIVKSLLYALLVNSSNDAAVALAENIPFPPSEETEQKFIELMNKKAASLNLKNTYFVDPSGLSAENYSCAWDISVMLQEVLKYPVLEEIMQTQEIDLYSIDGKFNHHLVNTDKLLGTVPEIIGGKTGYTEEAGNCMTAAFWSPNGQGMTITVLMDSPDRIAETKTLFEWTKKAFLW